MEEYTAFRAKNPTASCDPSSPPRIRLKPLLRSLVFDDAANLWVEHRSADGDMLGVFSPTGHLLGVMPAPAHDPDIPLYVRGTRLYAIELDPATGTQVLKAYRVARR